MTIKTFLSDNEIYQRLVETTYSMDDYSNINWRDKYRCERDYYGNVTKERFILYRTNSKGQKTGVRHLIVRGNIHINDSATVVDLYFLPSGNLILLIAVAIGILMYVIITKSYLYIIMAFILIVMGLGTAYVDYDDFMSYWDSSILKGS